MDNNTSNTFCINHQTLKAGFFLIEQPWLKYCSNCALNMALCGKTISKELSPQQFHNKMTLCSISSDMKHLTKQMQQTDKFLTKIIESIENKGKPIQTRLTMIDEQISNLMKVREGLVKHYEKQFSSKITHYFEQQSNNLLLSMEMKKQMDYIHSNFSNLIEMENNSQFESTTEKWRNLMHTTTSANLLNSDDMCQVNQNIKTTFKTFLYEFISLQKLKINLKTKDFSDILKTTEQQQQQNQHQKKQYSQLLSSYSNSIADQRQNNTYQESVYAQTNKPRATLKLRSNKKQTNSKMNSSNRASMGDISNLQTHKIQKQG